ncbi:Nif-specific regulatory protein [Budvicia aquatica]|uniref:Nif-specific regulatory protein n=2 Tax=Budvicia aquatica TaxID=82979 RepID=A0A2C6DLC6_9GAMM|nr:sigma-54-dependent Fis family transcriptional regulator [Budvicia aquatica]GKX50196.1 sigma-54-dependent Fis family transcriptional regulator [Budvicia aquatica]VFS47883.1 Nif-specific regulatory protein [Budvicia aquatica]
MNLNSGVSNNETNFVASAPSSVSLFSLAKRVAKYNVPVLITGETGTGKECVAKYIHHYAFQDSGAPYVGLNCAAIPESMLEAMLFGYEKGAFTGAVTSVPGKFEQANGGTLLLDEIGDMPLALQAKLLRVLQEQEVERLGSHKKIPLNIRLIASTNKNLELEIEEGRFRQDLFYRLSVVPIHIAPLRERSEDILPLANRFIRKYGMFTSNSVGLSEDAQRALQMYEWPGNVRELENVIQRGIIMSNNGVIHAQDLGLDKVLDAVSDAIEPQMISQPTNEPARHLKVRGRIAEYQYIVDLLKRHQGNKSKTAKFLGITPRALRYRLASMREQGIDVECFS